MQSMPSCYPAHKCALPACICAGNQTARMQMCTIKCGEPIHTCISGMEATRESVLYSAHVQITVL